MGSSSPVARPSPAPLVQVDRARYRARVGDDTSVCFAVENPSPARSRSEHAHDGSITLLTTVRGPVVRVTRDVLEIEDGAQRVRVRHLLPSGVDLGPLQSHLVHLEVRQVLFPGRTPTVDARMSTPDGALLMWARDGVVPDDGAIAEGAVRISCRPHGSSRLAVAWHGAVTSTPVGQIGQLSTAEGRLLLLPLRIDASDIAFVLMRG